MILTPNSFRAAGEATLLVSWSDQELDHVITGLRCVIPWLEGAGYTKRIVGSLMMELATFERMQAERES